MLRECWWQGEQINCSEIFTPVITDTGVCCAFNLGSHFKESNYSQLVKEMQVMEEIINVRFTAGESGSSFKWEDLEGNFSRRSGAEGYHRQEL